MKAKSKQAKDEKINDVEVEAYLKRAIEIEPMALEEEFVRMPADIAYWNERHSNALLEYLEAKMERERIHGELLVDPSFYDTVEQKLGKKPTVEQLKAAAFTAPTHLAAKMRENTCDVERQRMRGCVAALGAKRDMLISLGAHVRLEMQNDPVVRRNMSALREVDPYDYDAHTSSRTEED